MYAALAALGSRDEGLQPSLLGGENLAPEDDEPAVSGRVRISDHDRIVHTPRTSSRRSLIFLRTAGDEDELPVGVIAQPIHLSEPAVQVIHGLGAVHALSRAANQFELLQARRC